MVDFHEKSNLKSIAIINSLTKGDFKKAWNNVVGIAKKALSKDEKKYLSYESREDQYNLIYDCIYAKGGDVSARNRTVELGTVYLNLTEESRQTFHDILARDFDIDRQVLANKMDELKRARNKKEIIKAEIELKKALIPPRQILFKQFSSLPNGLKLLIDIRAALLAKVKKDQLINKLSVDIKELLSAWFDIGLLDLREITWNSPAALLEKLIAYEAVHEIRSWDDLRNRLDSDRLCFAFFHNKMPTEPLIFVEVALVSKLSDNIQELLNKEDELIDSKQANTAIFYSISNTQLGLAGISLGNFLIKTVVQKLSVEFDQIKYFATLSPVPGFRKWLDSKLSNGENELLKSKEIESLKKRYDCKNVAKKLGDLISSDWYDEPEIAKIIRPILTRLCAHYLVKERRGHRALDPVAHFHQSNGAWLQQINWLADCSDSGKKRSFGFMVNYYYKLSDIDKNHERYVTKTKINASKSVKALV